MNVGAEEGLTPETLEARIRERVSGLSAEQRYQLQQRQSDVMAAAISTYVDMRLSGRSAGDVGFHAAILMACLLAQSRAYGNPEVIDHILEESNRSIRSMIETMVGPLGEVDKLLKALLGGELPPDFRL